MFCKFYKNVFKRIFVALLVIGSFSCAIARKDMYVQPDLPLDQVAMINRLTNEKFIYVFLYFYAESIQIVSIDGKPVEFASKLKLLPGRHEIVAQYHETGGSPTKSDVQFTDNIFVDMEAGREYKIRGGAKDGVVRIWVEDIETKEVVGMSSMIFEK